MRAFFILSALITLAQISILQSGCGENAAQWTAEQQAYVDSLQTIRHSKDQYFKMAEDSPLPADMKPTFSGLQYYPIKPNRVYALKIHRIEQPDTFQIMTSRGIDRPALRYGYFEFAIDGNAQRLYAYKLLDIQAQYPGHMFVPFLDPSSGEDTYGGGRYLDLEENAIGEYLIDFNSAYNPSCAYGRDVYRCPIPPAENTLTVAVLAGEKKWHD